MTDSITIRRAPILDGRLSAAVELAGNTKLFADIGADHGRLSAVLLLKDPQCRALVADISSAALSKAQTRITRMGLEKQAVFCVADGLDALDALQKETPDTVFVLGMGGDTVSGILLRGAYRLRGAQLVLGAQTELPLVRETLCKIGYRIRREVVANENNRDYVLLLAQSAESKESAYTEEELLLGPVLLRELPSNWLPVLQRRERLLKQGLQAMASSQSEKDSERFQLFQRELSYVQQAMEKIAQKG